MLSENFKPFHFKCFDLKTFEISSLALKNNPLGDSCRRLNPVLLPKEPGEYSCVFVLSGFTSNGQKNLNFKSYEMSFAEEIDQWTDSNAISKKIYVFIDAWSRWGGSQFINSKGCGNYEDYIVQEVVPGICTELEKSEYVIKDSALLGGSSGGYGALHLCSKHPHVFNHCLAIAPDSDFEMSLKPEIYHALPSVLDSGGAFAYFEKIKRNEINTHHKSFHTVVNVLAMAACYSEIDDQNMPILPLKENGDFDTKLWSKWLEHDPVVFLNKRVESLKSLKTIFLSVGIFDQFLLQYGARKIKKIFEENDVEFVYEEFRGNHFDIGSRRKKALTLI